MAKERSALWWEITKFLITAVGAAVLFLVGIWQFSITARNEIAKPVFAKQLELCVEVSQAAATLARSDINTEVRAESRTTFLSNYFGKLAVVEDQCLYYKMIEFKRIVLDPKEADEQNKSKKEMIEILDGKNRAALGIAFACRRLISKFWNTGVLSFYDPDDLARTYNDLRDYRETIASCESPKKR